MSKTTPISNSLMAKLISPKSRPWYMKKRNMIRLGIVLAWLTGVIVVMAKYSAEVRDILWLSISGYCGVLFLITFIITHIMQRSLQFKARSHWMEHFILLILFVMSLYPIFQMGNLAADIIQGPIIIESKIKDQWDPTRGGDMVRTWDGKQYEIADSKIRLEVGRLYKLHVLSIPNLFWMH